MDIGVLVSQAFPYLGALTAAYGGAVLQRAQEEASNSTVEVGRRLLSRLTQRDESRPAIETAVTDLAEHPEDEDFQAAVRAQVRKALISPTRSWRRRSASCWPTPASPAPPGTRSRSPARRACRSATAIPRPTHSARPRRDRFTVQEDGAVSVHRPVQAATRAGRAHLDLRERPGRDASPTQRSPVGAAAWDV